MSSIYRIGLQKARGGHRLVLFSGNNGKLILSGETIKNIEDACAVMNDLANAWCDKRNIVLTSLEVYPASHKWPKNSGPKKKAAKLSFRVDNPAGYKDITIRRTRSKK